MTLGPAGELRSTTSDKNRVRPRWEIGWVPVGADGLKRVTKGQTQSGAWEEEDDDEGAGKLEKEEVVGRLNKSQWSQTRRCEQ